MRSSISGESRRRGLISTRFGRARPRPSPNGSPRRRQRQPRPLRRTGLSQPRRSEAGATSTCGRWSSSRCCRPVRAGETARRCRRLAGLGPAPAPGSCWSMGVCARAVLSTGFRPVFGSARRGGDRRAAGSGRAGGSKSGRRSRATLRGTQCRLFRRRVCARCRARRRARSSRSRSCTRLRAAAARSTPAAWSRLAPTAALRIIETFAGSGATGATTCVELRLAAGAVLTRGAWSRRRRRRRISAQLMATLGRSARLTGFALLLGGRTLRHEDVGAQRGREDAACGLNGAFLVAAARRRTSSRRSIIRAGGETRETVQGGRGRPRARRLSGPHHRPARRAKDRCPPD